MGNKDRKGSKAPKITKPPNTVINTPDTRLMVINTRSRNFFRKMFTSVESVYHHKPPPITTPDKTNNSIRYEGSSPKTEAPAKTAIKTTIATGLETVRKKG